MSNLQEREAVRRARVLQALERFDPAPLADKTLLAELQKSDADLRYSLPDLRRILKYLQGHGLALLRFGGKDNIWEAGEADTWISTISSQGVDYMAGFGERLPGVYRPE